MRQLSLKGLGEGRGTFRHMAQLGKAWLWEWKERVLSHRCLIQMEMVPMVGGGQVVERSKRCHEGLSGKVPWLQFSWGHTGPVKSL